MPSDSKSDSPPLLVVMGVCGCGKSTVGAALGERLGIPFADADPFHPKANVEKMHAGIALTDADRAPWLDTLARWLRGHADTGAVLACSALKRAYRERLQGGGRPPYFIHLAGASEVVAARVAARQGHFMPASLVQSQYAALEPLGADEAGVTLDFALPVEQLVEESLTAWRRHAARSAEGVSR